MKAFAVALLGLAVSAPAMAGPYVESKHEFKGTDEDFSKAVHQGRVGYEWKLGRATPYIEGGLGVLNQMLVIKKPLRHLKSVVK